MSCDPGDRDSIPDRKILYTKKKKFYIQKNSIYKKFYIQKRKNSIYKKKTVLHDSWPSTQQYKLRIKGKVEQSRESSTLPITSLK